LLGLSCGLGAARGTARAPDACSWAPRALVCGRQSAADSLRQTSARTVAVLFSRAALFCTSSHRASCGKQGKQRTPKSVSSAQLGAPQLAGCERPKVARGRRALDRLQVEGVGEIEIQIQIGAAASVQGPDFPSNGRPIELQWSGHWRCLGRLAAGLAAPTGSKWTASGRCTSSGCGRDSNVGQIVLVVCPERSRLLVWPGGRDSRG